MFLIGLGPSGKSTSYQSFLAFVANSLWTMFIKLTFALKSNQHLLFDAQFLPFSRFPLFEYTYLTAWELKPFRYKFGVKKVKERSRIRYAISDRVKMRTGVSIGTPVIGQLLAVPKWSLYQI